MVHKLLTVEKLLTLSTSLTTTSKVEEICPLHPRTLLNKSFQNLITKKLPLTTESSQLEIFVRISLVITRSMKIFPTGNEA